MAVDRLPFWVVRITPTGVIEVLQVQRSIDDAMDFRVEVLLPAVLLPYQKSPRHVPDHSLTLETFVRRSLRLARFYSLVRVSEEVLVDTRRAGILTPGQHLNDTSLILERSNRFASAITRAGAF